MTNLEVSEAPADYQEDDVVEPAPCFHEHVSDEAGSPSPSGRCIVYAVCEDCGENLGAIGTDSVL